MQKHLLLAALAAAGACGQTPAFEVASIRPAAQITPETIAPGRLHVGMKIDEGKVDIGHLSLRDLMMLAYEVKLFQISGPEWVAQERFDVLAKIPEGGTKDQVPAMLRALLAERFKLMAHREQRELSVYALVVANGGPKFKEPPADSPAASGTARDATAKITPAPNGQIRMEVERMPMSRLAETLTQLLNHPVIDHTGLNGSYQFALELSIQDVAQAMGGSPFGAAPQPPGGTALAASDPSGGSVFQSIQRLGLRLEKQKASIETIVIDSVEKSPTEN